MIQQYVWVINKIKYARLNKYTRADILRWTVQSWDFGVWEHSVMAIKRKICRQIFFFIFCRFALLLYLYMISYFIDCQVGNTFDVEVFSVLVTDQYQIHTRYSDKNF